MAQLKDTTVDGELEVNGVSVNDKLELVDKIYKAFTVSDTLTCTAITPGDNYSKVSGSIARVGSVLRISITEAVRKTGSPVGNINNEVVAKFDFVHNGKIKSIYNSTAITSSTGGVSSFYTTGNTIDGNNGSITVSTGATTVNSTSYATYIVVPVVLNINAF